MSGLGLKSTYDQTIWKQLKVGNVNQSLLRKDHRLELFQLNEHFRRHVFKLTRHHTTNHCVTKNAQGYTIRRRCFYMHAKNCKSSWLLKIDVRTGESQLSCDKMCKHLVKSLPKGFIYICFS